MNLQAIIFDLDGVLADSEPLWNDIDGALLAEYGVTYGGEHKHQVLGKSFTLALQFYKEQFGIPHSIEALQARRTAIATEYYRTRIGTFSGANDVLAQLKALDLRIGLASSSVGDLVLPFLERHGLRDYFDEVVTGEEVIHGKPSPDIYLRAAEKLQVEPQLCLVVEDALSGIQAGKSAGMSVAAIPDPRFVDIALYEDKVDYLLANLSELPELVRRLRQ